MKKKFRAIIAAVSITFAMVFSCRIVMVPTALTQAETVALICMLIEYTVLRTKTLEDKDEDTKRG